MNIRDWSRQKVGHTPPLRSGSHRISAATQAKFGGGGGGGGGSTVLLFLLPTTPTPAVAGGEENSGRL